jgi:hypothetical protein
MMATAYFAAKRRANGCPDSRSDSHNSGGRLGLVSFVSSHWHDHLRDRASESEVAS